MWLRPQGYATISEDGKVVKEFDTLSCGHCNRIVHVKAKCRPEDIGGLCAVCKKAICPACVGHGCDEIERWLDRTEASYHARRSYFGE